MLEDAVYCSVQGALTCSRRWPKQTRTCYGLIVFVGKVPGVYRVRGLKANNGDHDDNE